MSTDMKPVRVTVYVPYTDAEGVARKSKTDVHLPTEKTLVSQLIPDLVLFLRENLEHQGSPNTALNQPERSWVLSADEVSRTRLDPGKSLADQDVPITDGTELYLTGDDAREHHTPLIDDTADAIATTLRTTFPEWSRDHALTATRWAIGTLGVILPLTAIWIGLSMPVVWTVRAGMVSALLLTGVLAMIYIVPATNTRSAHDPARRATSAVALTGYAAFTAAGVCIFPGELSAYHLACAGLFLTVTGLTMRSLLIDALDEITYAAITLGCISIVAAGLGALFKGGPLTLGASLAITAVFTVAVLSNERRALSLAGISAPFVPTAGESFLTDDRRDLASIPANADAQAVAEVVGQRGRIIAAWAIRVGLDTGCLIALVVGGIITAWTMGDTNIGGFLLCCLLCAVTLFKARAQRDAFIRTCWYATLIILAGSILITLIAGSHAPSFVGPFAALIVIATAAGIILVAYNHTYSNPKARHAVELIESACFAAIVADYAWVVDLWGLIRHS